MDDQEVRYSFTGTFENIANAVRQVINLLGRVSNAFRRTDESGNMDRSNRALQRFRQTIASLRESFNRMRRQTRSLSDQLQGLARAGTIARKALGAITGVKLGEWLSSGVKESIAYIENLNLFRVAMGKSVDVGEEFVQQMSEVFGMDPSNLYRYSGFFYQLTDAIGMTDEASAVLSLSLTKAANDVASLFNVDIETVVNNFGSGMQGMTRAVRKYGVDIRSTTLQQTAFAYGLTEQVENMSEANRMALRYLTMMDQIKNATRQTVGTTGQASDIMGDFARNIETPANQLRIFKEQVTQLGRAIGNFLIPILSRLLPIINGVIMALRTVLTFIAALTGFNMNFGGISTGAEDTAAAFEGIGSAAGDAAAAAKELRKTLAPFDELNLLQAPHESSGGGGGGGMDSGVLDPALLEAIKNMSLSLEDIEMKANKVRDKLLEFFGFKYVDVFNPNTGEFESKLQWFADQFRDNLINKFPQWTKTIQAVFDTWSDNIEAFKNVWRSLGEVVDKIRIKIKNFIDSLHLDDTFSQGIRDLSTNLNTLSTWISNNSDSLANVALLVAGIVGAFSLFSKISRYLSPVLRVGSAIVTSLAPLAEVVTVVAAVVAAIVLLYQNSASFATSFDSLLSTVVASVGAVASSVGNLIGRIWASLQSLWTEHLQPMVASIGDFLAPVLDTLGVLWTTVSTIIQSIMELLGTLWETVISPVLGAIADTITHIMEILQKLWEEVIGPVLENILESLPELFDGTIQPILEGVVSIIGGLIEAILDLWNNVLAPLVYWLVSALGPSIRNVLNTVWEIVSAVVSSIGKIIGGLVQILQGVVDFVAGVFTGDWRRAWEGIKEIFGGIINSIVGIFESGVNLIISLVNSVISLVFSAVQAFVNAILEAVNSVGRLVGRQWSFSWSSAPPAIGYVSFPRVEFATGGVVTGPTNALIGEGRYDEAVIPLGNSPQMKELVNSIVDGTNNTEQVTLLREQNSLLRQILDKTGVYLDGQELTNTVTKHQRRNERSWGSI